LPLRKKKKKKKKEGESNHGRDQLNHSASLQLQEGGLLRTKTEM
jgi:hypothetical protein